MIGREGVGGEWSNCLLVSSPELTGHPGVGRL